MKYNTVAEARQNKIKVRVTHFRLDPDELHKFRKFNIEEIEITNIKLPAIAYIDDLAIKFTNWKEILDKFGI